jgi:hypothetical protein
MSGLAGSLILGKIASGFRAVPSWAWKGLAVIVLLIGGYLWHGHKVRAHDKAIIAAEDALIADQALAMKRKIDALTQQISTIEKAKNDEENRRIDRAADAIGVRGPGKAACSRNTGVPAPAGGPRPASGSGSAAPASVPSDDGLAGVQWNWLVATGRTCDLNRAETLGWRSWYRQMVEAWPKGSEKPANGH